MKILLLLSLSFSANVFASTNMLAPILNCKLTNENIAKITQSKSYDSEGFTVLADLQDLASGTDGRSILVYSAKQVGAISSQDESSESVGSGEFGTFIGSSIDKDKGLQSGVLFRGDLVDYNYKYKSISVLTLKIDKEKKIITAELKSEPKGESDYVSIKNYNCTSEFAEK